MSTTFRVTYLGACLADSTHPRLCLAYFRHVAATGSIAVRPERVLIALFDHAAEQALGAGRCAAASRPRGTTPPSPPVTLHPLHTHVPQRCLHQTPQKQARPSSVHAPPSRASISVRICHSPSDASGARRQNHHRTTVRTPVPLLNMLSRPRRQCLGSARSRERAR